MRIQIGVMGSAGGEIAEDDLEAARRLGRRIAQRDCVIVTGACPGLPHAAVLGAHEAGGASLGVSPARSREEHVDVFDSPLDPSLNTAAAPLAGRPAHNWIGIAGAFVADIVLQLLGLSAFLLPAFLGMFSLSWFRSRPVGPCPRVVRKSSFVTNARGWCGITMQIRPQLVAISVAPPAPGSRTFGLA